MLTLARAAALFSALSLDLTALYCAGCAALYAYRAYSDQVRGAAARGGPAGRLAGVARSNPFGTFCHRRG